MVLFLFRVAVTVAEFSVAWMAGNQWWGVSETWRLGLPLQLCLSLSLSSVCVLCMCKCVHKGTYLCMCVYVEA